MTHQSQGEDIDGFFTTARTSGRDTAVELPTDGYQNYLFDLDDPQVAAYRGMTYEEFTRDRQSAQFLRDLLDYWDSQLAEPFVGITTDGSVRGGVYGSAGEYDGSDQAARAAARTALTVLDDGVRERFEHPIDAQEWRSWSNPEFVFHRNGLRLEDLPGDQVDAILAMVQASLSPAGYERVIGAMDLNGYLGELTGLPTIMNNRSYWVSLFGDPTGENPWGWQLFGHHVAVNCIWVGGRCVIAPVFIGAEPALSDVYPPLFAAREQTAIELASSLTPQQRARAVVYNSVLDPAMPEGRLHPADERHVGGAFRDNRVVPYEGIPAGELTSEQQALLRSIVEDFQLLLPEDQRALTMADYDAQLGDTWFSWYGATDGSQPFYLRIQSPVVLAELDHHAGVWLTNRLPARFHVHTTLRLPNGNDYGRAYLAEWDEQHDRR
ncbi:uncharacterized protein DUF3500 [Branchiibius hedensis]|uniref:DUF3500 domain-containing protein n=1 Tax=Branchiibius hedensis TaxID=672460 RepID=A0A2Y8ZWH6_9MICO|nr:DUF3500 domain-containing protein [Branchiibius hedensis]PWJ26817.1 uncharacterized protein DUF3500 [Branchiibius hedensis]SSA35628.1 Protein of unknown function [Branchiibius hedensis]